MKYFGLFILALYTITANALTAKVQFTSNEVIKGTIIFEQNDANSPVNISIDPNDKIIINPTNPNGFNWRVHEKAKSGYSSADCLQAFEYYNPTFVSAPGIELVGDLSARLGNLMKDPNGFVFDSAKTDTKITLFGTDTIIGRSITVMNGAARIACESIYKFENGIKVDEVGLFAEGAVGSSSKIRIFQPPGLSKAQILLDLNLPSVVYDRLNFYFTIHETVSDATADPCNSKNIGPAIMDLSRTISNMVGSKSGSVAFQSKIEVDELLFKPNGSVPSIDQRTIVLRNGYGVPIGCSKLQAGFIASPVTPSSTNPDIIGYTVRTQVAGGKAGSFELSDFLGNLLSSLNLPGKAKVFEKMRILTQVSPSALATSVRYFVEPSDPTASEAKIKSELEKAFSFMRMGRSRRMAPSTDSIEVTPTVMLANSYNNQKDLYETDIDCGSTDFNNPGCAALKSCVADTDCETGTCSGGACLSIGQTSAASILALPNLLILTLFSFLIFIPFF